MLFHRLGFSSAASDPARRYCYVRPALLEQLLEAPGTLEALAQELGVAPLPSSFVEQLDALRRRAIHLSVTPSPVQGLSLEEILVITVYQSVSFEQSQLKRELTRRPTNEELLRAAEQWLHQRTPIVMTGRKLGGPRWQLLGCSSNEPAQSELIVALATLADVAGFSSDIERLAADGSFAHEHYVACTPATAMAIVAAQARSSHPHRWDPLYLDRRLRSHGLGLLLVEREGVLLHMPARYQVPRARLPLLARQG